jgi:hypothetical protein
MTHKVVPSKAASENSLRLHSVKLWSNPDSSVVGACNLKSWNVGSSLSRGGYSKLYYFLLIKKLKTSSVVLKPLKFIPKKENLSLL